MREKKRVSNKDEEKIFFSERSFFPSLSDGFQWMDSARYLTRNSTRSFIKERQRNRGWYYSKGKGWKEERISSRRWDKIFRKIFSRNARTRECFVSREMEKKSTSFSLQKLLLENKRAGIKRSINIQFVFPV